MAFFDAHEMKAALTRLGEIAGEDGETVELFIVGGANMILRHGSRASTQDIDAVFLAPTPVSRARMYVERVAWSSPSFCVNSLKGITAS